MAFSLSPYRFCFVFCFALIAPLALSTTAFSAPFTLDKTLIDPTPTGADQFGILVSLDDGRALVGANLDDSSASNAGQAHLFDITTGTLLQTFNNPSPNSNDQFGTVSLDGNFAVVGARLDDSEGFDVGRAYVFDTVTGNLLSTLIDPTPTHNDQSGITVSANAGRVLVGAPTDDTAGFGVGDAHLFDAISGSLLQTFTNPNPSTNDFFGAHVALDGNLALIGARREDAVGSDAGAAYLFDVTTGSLLQSFFDPNPTGSDDFGSRLDLDNGRVLIGARGDDTLGSNVGQAHLFDAVSGTLLQTFNDPTATTGDGFGSSVALDGDLVLIGAGADDSLGTDIGQAYLFDAVSGLLVQTLNDPTPTDSDRFGTTVALDGNWLAVGDVLDDTNGVNVGQVHLYKASVPSPGAMMILMIGMCGIGVGRRHRLTNA